MVNQIKLITREMGLNMKKSKNQQLASDLKKIGLPVRIKDGKIIISKPK